MIEKIIEFSIRNRFVVILLTLAVIGAGVYAVVNTPIDAIPDLSENQVIVFTDWMGRSPRDIEDQITYPLSVNLQGLAGVKAVRSRSEFNFSMIDVIFDDKVDFYFARQRVLERLALASTFLPPGVVPYMAPDATALGQIFWYTVEGKGYDLGRLRAVEDWYVRYQLNSVPGVAQVASVGGYPIEYQIERRSPQAPRLRRHAGRIVRGRGPLQFVGGRPGDPQGQRRVPDPRRRVDPLGGRHRKHRRAVRSGQGDAHPGLEPGQGGPGNAVPPQRARERRQRGGRRRGHDAPRRKPPGRHQAHQGEDRRASGGPAAGRPHRPLLRPHPADRRRHPHPGHDPLPRNAHRLDRHPPDLDALPQCAGHLPDAAAGRPGVVHPHAPAGHRLEHHVAFGHRHFDRRPGGPGDRDGRERHAPPHGAFRQGPRDGRHPRTGPPRLPHGGPAHLLLGDDHPPVVHSGVRLDRPGGQDVPPAGLHEEFRHDRRGHPLHHARAGVDPDVPPRPAPQRGGKLVGPQPDRHLQTLADLDDAAAEPGHVVVLRAVDRRGGPVPDGRRPRVFMAIVFPLRGGSDHCRQRDPDRRPPLASLVAGDPDGPCAGGLQLPQDRRGIHAGAGRRQHPRHAGHGAAGVGRRGGRRHQGPRRLAPPLSRGGNGRRQGGPRRDAHRPLAAGNAGNGRQLAAQGVLAQATPQLRRRRAANGGRAGKDGPTETRETVGGRGRSQGVGQRRHHDGRRPDRRHAARARAGTIPGVRAWAVAQADAGVRRGIGLALARRRPLAARRERRGNRPARGPTGREIWSAAGRRARPVGRQRADPGDCPTVGCGQDGPTQSAIAFAAVRPAAGGVAASRQRAGGRAAHAVHRNARFHPGPPPGVVERAGPPAG